MGGVNIRDRPPGQERLYCERPIMIRIFVLLRSIASANAQNIATHRRTRDRLPSTIQRVGWSWSRIRIFHSSSNNLILSEIRWYDIVEVPESCSKRWSPRWKPFDTLGSTNDWAKRRAAEPSLPAPFVGGDRGTDGGPGRGANRWWSASGSLIFSLVLPPERIRRRLWLGRR